MLSSLLSGSRDRGPRDHNYAHAAQSFSQNSHALQHSALHPPTEKFKAVSAPVAVFAPEQKMRAEAGPGKGAGCEGDTLDSVGSRTPSCMRVLAQGKQKFTTGIILE